MESEKYIEKALMLKGIKIPKGRFSISLNIFYELLKNKLLAIRLNNDIRVEKSNDIEVRKIIDILYEINWIFLYTNNPKVVLTTLKALNFSQIKLGKSKELASSLSLYAMFRFLFKSAKNMNYALMLK